MGRHNWVRILTRNFYEIPSANLKALVSLSFSDYCRPLSKDESSLKDFTDQLLRLVEGEKVPILELRGVYPAHLSMYSYSNHVIYKLDLTSDVDVTWKGVRAMHRRNVRIAMDNDVEVICGDTVEHMAAFYHLHLLTRRRQGVPIHPWKFFCELERITVPLFYSSLKANPVHATEGCLARSMHFVIQKSSTWVCRFSGELLYRHFG